MKSVVIISLVLLVMMAGVSSFAQEKPQAIKVLLISGDDVAPFHDWREIAASTRKVLETCPMIEVVESEDTFILDSKAALEKYDVVLLTGYNAKTPTISDQAKENLVNFVKGGKGFMVTHLASASFKEWDEFGNLCGRKWVMGTSGHGPRSQFPATIAKKDHPITQGLEDFQIFDELYAKLQGDSDIEVLVTAESKDFSKQVEPLLFVKEYGKGRVVHDAFGHDHKAIENDTHKILLIRSCIWAATGNVSQGCCSGGCKMMGSGNAK